MRLAPRCALLLALLAAGAARAEEGDPLDGTLKAVRDRGTLLIGYRTSAPPFAFHNKASQPIGFSVDLCRGIAADVAAALSRDLVEADAPAWQKGVRIALVPVAAADRLPKLLDGTIDLECGSTTANAERAKSIAFSPVFFLAGTRLMVPTASPVESYRALAGRTIVVGGGGNNAAVIRRLAGSVAPPIMVAEAPGLDAAFEMLAAGRADAFASDDILLAGMIAARQARAKFRLVGDYLSFEPYAIGFRRDDPAFAALLRRSFERMASEGRLAALYNRWFTRPLPDGENLGLPMSPQLAEIFRALGQPD